MEYRNNNKVHFIVWLRAIAMISIIIAHYLQYTTNHFLGQLFNIGVPLFFIISAYLYGQKEIVDFKEWGIRRIKTIFAPFLLFIVIIFTVYYVIGVRIKFYVPFIYAVNLQNIPVLDRLLPTDLGLGHLWFMTNLMIYYFSIPFLQRIRDNNKSIYRYALLCSLLLITIIGPITPLFDHALWLYIYIFYFTIFVLAYMLSSINEKIVVLFKYTIYLTTVLSFFFISQEKIMALCTWEWFFTRFTGGWFVFFLFKDMDGLIERTKNNIIIDYISSNSYFYYLTHMVFIAGPLSVFIQPNCVLIVLILTFISGLLLSIVSKKSTMLLSYKFK